MTVDNTTRNAFVDTGARICVLSERLYRNSSSLKHKTLRPVKENSITSVRGQPLDILGCVNMNFELSDQYFIHKFVVARDIQQDIILGWDFLVANEIDVLVSESCLSIGNHKIPLLTMENLFPHVCSAVVAETMVIPANSEMIIPLKLLDNQDSQEVIYYNYEGIFEPDSHLDEDILVASVATKSEKGIIPVLVMNLSCEDVNIYANIPMGYYHSVQHKGGEIYEIMENVCEIDVKQNFTIPSQGQNRHKETHISQVNQKSTGKPYPKVDLSQSDLETDQKVQVEALLEEFDDIFSKHSRDYGRTDLISHKINLTESEPPKSRLYRVPPKQREVMRQKVDELVEDDLIEPSDSNFASPALLVRKKTPDNSVQYRLVIDFRAINKISLKDSHSLPRIDDSIDALVGNAHFSTLDLASGFWQVEMEESDRDITTFSTGDGLYKWKVMPMGLKNSSATFQRLMELIFHGMHWTKVCFFIDDVIIFGKTFDQKMANMRDAFTRLRKAGLKVRPDKCQLFCKEVTFLGHIVSREGVKPDPSNIEKVKNWPRPQNVTGLRGWLGLTGFYRKYIKSYAKIAQPLLHLIKKEVPFEWNEECEHSFQLLRKALISSPILRYPQYEQPFILYVDASGFAIGSILAQIGDDRKEHVVAYASHSLTNAERNWSTYDRELWAIVWSIRHFRHYLQFVEFTIITDHKPLVGLRKMPIENDPTGRRARWAVEIDPLNWIIVHKAGKSHTNADALSRRHNTEPDTAIKAEVAEIDQSNSQPKPKLKSILKTNNSSNSMRDESDNEMEKISENSDESHDDDQMESEEQFPLETDLSKLRQMQNNDSNIRQVKWWITKGSKPPRYKVRGNPILGKFWKVFDHLFVKDGVLWREYRQMGYPMIYQAVIPTSLVPHILSQLHGSELAGHYGIQKTVQKALQSYFWPLMYRDISQYCKRCVVCQKDNNPIPKRKAPLKPVRAERPFEMIAVDILELGLTSKGNRYLLVITDYYTKYVNMYPIPDQKAETVANCMFVNYIRQHSIPERIHSDQGVQFEAKVTQELCKKLGIEKSRTTPGHPEGDGQAERMMRTIRSQLVRNLTNSSVRDWDDMIPYLEFSYNTTVHTSTGFSPFYLVYGRQPRLPSEVMYGSYRAPEMGETRPQAQARQMCNRYNAAAKMVQRNTAEAKMNQKRNYDRHKRFIPYEIGSKVFITNPESARSKLTPRWKGPYQVLQSFNDDLNYQIVHLSEPSSKPKIVHYNRLKPMYETTGANSTKPETFVSLHTYKGPSQVSQPQFRRLRKFSRPQINQRNFRQSQPVRRRHVSESGHSPIHLPIHSPINPERNLLPADRQSALCAARNIVGAGSQVNERQAGVRTRSGRLVKPPRKLNL